METAFIEPEDVIGILVRHLTKPSRGSDQILTSTAATTITKTIAYTRKNAEPAV
jgi:hypothetical protein